MKTVYDLAVETNESDLFTEISEQLYFMSYPESPDSFQLSFDQAVCGYYYIREKGRGISDNNPNIEAIVFCEFITHKFYREERDSFLSWCNKDKPFYRVDIIYPHRVVMDYLIARKENRRKRVSKYALHSIDFEYIISTDIKYLAVPDSVIKKYGGEKVLASFLIVAFKTFFACSEIYNTDMVEDHNNVPANFARYYYKRCNDLVDELDLNNMYYKHYEYNKFFSDDVINEIIHHPMMRKVERDYGEL